VLASLLEHYRDRDDVLVLALPRGGLPVAYEGCHSAPVAVRRERQRQQRQEGSMAVRLNERAYAHARRLVVEERVVLDDRDEWSEHRPSAEQENRYIDEHGFAEYGRWYLGVDDEAKEDTKSHYKFPYGDFEKVHRCGVLAAESRAGQRKYTDIELAAAHLHGMLEG
jgi:hypothetical protein